MLDLPFEDVPNMGIIGMSNERWKSVVGWEGIYEVSILGRIRRIKPYYFSLKYPRIMKPCMSNGYLNVELHDSPKKFLSIGVHRLVAAAFIGPCPKGKNVNHKDRNRANNRIENLEYLTHRENIKHSYTFKDRLKNVSKGAERWNARLNKMSVLSIKKELNSGSSLANIARKYKVHVVTIFDIKHGKTWKHVGQTEE